MALHFTALSCPFLLFSFHTYIFSFYSQPDGSSDYVSFVSVSDPAMHLPPVYVDGQTHPCRGMISRCRRNAFFHGLHIVVCCVPRPKNCSSGCTFEQGYGRRDTPVPFSIGFESLARRDSVFHGLKYFWAILVWRSEGKPFHFCGFPSRN